MSLPASHASTAQHSGSTSELQAREAFLASLKAFNDETGRGTQKLPIMGYKELDLYAFFKEVQAHGGFHQVTNNVGTWSKIWKRLVNYDPSITDASFRLRKNYQRFLLEYEYKLYPHHRALSNKSGKYKSKHLKMSTPAAASSTSAPLPSASSAPPSSFQHLLNSSNSDILSSSSSSSSSSEQLPKKQPTKRKPGNPCRDVQRDANGNPKLPLVLGEVVIESLGTVINRPPYITDKHVWPVGFKSTRYFSSMLNPAQRVKYTSEIVDTGSKPEFVVTAEDDPMHPVVSHSPSSAWRVVLKRVMPKDDSRTNISVSGRVRFGLAHPVTVHLLREVLQGRVFSSGSELSTPISSPPSSPLRSSHSSSTGGSLKRKRQEESESVELPPAFMFASSSNDAMDIESASKPVLPSFKDLEQQLCASSLLMLLNSSNSSTSTSSSAKPPAPKKQKPSPPPSLANILNHEDSEESAIQTLQAFKQFCPPVC